MTIQNNDATKIAQQWIDLWNNNTVENYLKQYTDDAILVSNVALILFPDSHGRIVGKELLLEYWKVVRIKFPQFKFHLNRFETYANKIIIYYETVDTKTKAIAILTVNFDLLIERCEVSYV